jgi:hypothetical protein
VTGARPAMSRAALLSSLAIGAAAAAFVVMNVLRDDATVRPDQPYLTFALLWRGVAYGIVDAILLSAFPGLVAFAVMNKDLTGIGRRVGFAALSLALTLVITTSYHLGYKQFREDGVRAPIIGNTIISVPTLLTANPIGSIVAHASMHVTATYHVYETETFLPPQTDVED